MGDEVIIVGAGIGGLTLGLALHQAKISCRIFESAPAIKPIGVGINLLPHATKELAALGLEPDLAKAAITTTDRKRTGSPLAHHAAEAMPTASGVYHAPS